MDGWTLSALIPGLYLGLLAGLLGFALRRWSGGTRRPIGPRPSGERRHRSS